MSGLRLMDYLYVLVVARSAVGQPATVGLCGAHIPHASLFIYRFGSEAQALMLELRGPPSPTYAEQSMLFMLMNGVTELARSASIEHRRRAVPRGLKMLFSNSDSTTSRGPCKPRCGGDVEPPN